MLGANNEFVCALPCLRGGFNLREAREFLEASFMDEAEIVFTTLSSSARHAFTKIKRPFDIVLIDEAAQAAEITALQPLVYGCKHCVLVGDPQQLPATVFSSQVRGGKGDRGCSSRLA